MLPMPSSGGESGGPHGIRGGSWPKEKLVETFGQEAAVADALRAMLSEVPEAGGQPLDVLLGECDARSYAPAASQIAPLPDELRLRAREIAKALEEAGQ